MDRLFFESHGVSQREGESELAFRAFRAYLQTPLKERSLRKLEGEGYAWGSLSRWSSEHAWQERAREFDRVMAEEGLSLLLAQRKGLVVAALTESLEDATVLRERVMHAAQRGKSPADISTLVTSRVELDAWMAQILGTVNILGGGEDGKTD